MFEYIHLLYSITWLHTLVLHAVGLGEAAVGVVARQEAVLQVDYGLSYFLVPGQHVVVVHTDLQVLVLRQETRHLEHPWKKKHVDFRRV